MLEFKVESTDNDELSLNLYGSLIEPEIVKLNNFLEEKKFKNNIIIDANNLEYIDSSGIGLLISQTKKFSLCNKRIVLKNINSKILKVLKLSNANKVLNIDYNSEEEKNCGSCFYFFAMNQNIGRCKCETANGYDLIVENTSYCNSYKK